MVLEIPTWRANKNRAEELSYDRVALAVADVDVNVSTAKSNTVLNSRRKLRRRPG
jgi:hypothetical protein